jgi:hypothetical protein
LTAFFATGLTGAAFLGAGFVAFAFTFAFTVSLLAVPGRTMVCVEVASRTSFPLEEEVGVVATL